MKNTIDARIEFDFQGCHHAPSATIDLDRLLQTTGELPSLHLLIARDNNIDLYSYEYEIMLGESVQVSNATGMVEEFVHDGLLDEEAFTSRWRELRVLEALQEIAARTLSIDDLERDPALKDALLAAYQLGQGAD